MVPAVQRMRETGANTAEPERRGRRLDRAGRHGRAALRAGLPGPQSQHACRKSDAIHKPFEHAGKRLGPRHEADMAGALEHHVSRAFEISPGTPRHVDGHHAIEARLAGHDQRRRRDPRADPRA